MTATFGIGEVARRVGVRASTVRYYEERGLIAPEGRSGGKRVYAQQAVERMALIAFAKGAGFSLDEMFLECGGLPPLFDPVEKAVASHRTPKASVRVLIETSSCPPRSESSPRTSSGRAVGPRLP